MKQQRKLGSLGIFHYICNVINDNGNDNDKVNVNGLMATKGFLHKVFDLYYDGFRQMTLGRTLWAIILIKMFIIFVVLKLFFFPNFIKEHANKGEEADFVATQMLKR